MARYYSIIVCTSFTLASAGLAAPKDAADPVAHSAAMVVVGNARFTILHDGLVRLEYSPDGVFEDRASQVFINRRLPIPSFTQADRQGWLTIRTNRMEIRYKDNGESFSKKNLAVMIKTPPNDTTWELAPPFENRSNLGGTARCLDDVDGPCALEPGLLCQSGWTFIDDSRSLVFSVGDQPWPTPRGRKDATDWYFLAYGRDYKGALGIYTQVAGRIPIPPDYAFGIWWSRYWAYTADELKQLVGEFREHQVPLDVLVVDMDWHLDGWTGYTWNPKYFPDPVGFLNWAHDQKLHVTLNLHPADGVGKHETQFAAMCRATSLDADKTDRIPFDCTDPRFVDAYFKLLHHPLEKMGVDFWWIDWQQGRKSKIDGLDPLWWLNHLHWTDMQRRADETDKRPLILSRWGGLGSHRYPIQFSGDTYSDWKSLAFQPRFTATAANVGAAYWSHDLGGHFPGVVDPELYVRWLQFGAVSPIFRTHTSKSPQAERRIWKLPPEYFEAARAAYSKRRGLMPYLIRCAQQCNETGVAPCRPLYYEWPDEPEAYRHEGQYMLGDQVLVAPVTQPADPVSGCAMIEVWLPPGKWTYWHSNRTYDGGRAVPMAVPLDEIPLFVRGGEHKKPLVASASSTPAEIPPLAPMIIRGPCFRAMPPLSISSRAEPERSRELTRVLGLFYRLDVSTTDESGRTFQAVCRLAATQPIEGVEKLDGTVRLLPGGRFVPESEGEKTFNALTEDEPVVVAMNIENTAVLQPMRVRGEIDLTADGNHLHVPLQKTVLPSINAWWVVGPFDAGELDRELPPEGKPDFSETYQGQNGGSVRWRRSQREIKPGDDPTEDFYVEFDRALGMPVKNGIAYGLAFVDCAAETDAVLRFNCDGPAIVRLNDRKVFRQVEGMGRTDEPARAPIHFKRGSNVLLVKQHIKNGGRFAARVEDAQGNPPAGVLFKLTP